MTIFRVRMTAAFRSPALQWFVQQIGDELLVAQVLVRRKNGGFELRHVADREVSSDKLTVQPHEGAHGIAQVTEDGSFRPLKSSPNLQRGWLILAKSDLELETTLDRIYPGLIPDLFAVRTSMPHITHYREFTNRQTGMYRITTFLTDAEAFAMAGKCCSATYCLKQRLWTVEGLPLDQLEGKSLIPCLEPCAILLEYARKVVRTSRRENVPAQRTVEMLEPDARQEE
jgi:hypothetical protein